MISLLGNLAYIIRGSSNGRTAAFEAANRGSNPCPRTKAMLCCYFLKIVGQDQ